MGKKRKIGVRMRIPYDNEAGPRPHLYDYTSATDAGITSDNSGHWPSRVGAGPKEGLILKLPGHETLHKTVAGERKAGYQIEKRGSRMWSFPGRSFSPPSMKQRKKGKRK